jgi:hypothetical protein
MASLTVAELFTVVERFGICPARCIRWSADRSVKGCVTAMAVGWIATPPRTSGPGQLTPLNATQRLLLQPGTAHLEFAVAK